MVKKAVQFGRQISHSNRKSQKRFLPNIQSVSLQSEALGKVVRLNIATNTLRSIDHNGGLDNYLLTTSNIKLSAEAIRLKRQIRKAVESKTLEKATA